jgi:mannose-6-phosphate isomerase-like protein (cupin superfamily)
MSAFETRQLAAVPIETAPDGSEVRPLLRLDGGSMAHCRLAAGRTSAAVVHRSVEEIWYVTAGRGEMWRSRAGWDEFSILEPGVCVTIPHGTRFQFRASAAGPLEAIGVTMPPWPGEGEATLVDGPWDAS